MRSSTDPQHPTTTGPLNCLSSSDLQAELPGLSQALAPGMDKSSHKPLKHRSHPSSSLEASQGPAQVRPHLPRNITNQFKTSLTQNTMAVFPETGPGWKQNRVTPDLGAFCAVLTPPNQRILSVTKKQLGNGAVQRSSCRTPSPSEK